MKGIENFEVFEKLTLNQIAVLIFFFLSRAKGV